MQNKQVLANYWLEKSKGNKENLCSPYRKTPWPMPAVLNNLMKPFETDEGLVFFVQEYAKARQIKGDEIVKTVLHLRHARNRYDTLKYYLKKSPERICF